MHYDEDSLTIRNLSSASGSRAQESNAFVEDELNSMNRADDSPILLVVHEGRVRKRVAQKMPITFSEHEVH